jgi:prefoldin subunit 5
MSDNIENLIIEHLKAIRAEVASVKTDTREIRSRISSMESSLARLSRETLVEL